MNNYSRLMLDVSLNRNSIILINILIMYPYFAQDKMLAINLLILMVYGSLVKSTNLSHLILLFYFITFNYLGNGETCKENHAKLYKFFYYVIKNFFK